jgi:hypothetical protein
MQGNILIIKRHVGFQIRDVWKRVQDTYPISMDTVLLLETIVHFYSYKSRSLPRKEACIYTSK